MTAKPITTFILQGRTNTPSANKGPAALTCSLDFTAAGDYLVDFSSYIGQGQFSVAKGVFFDNSNNPNELIITDLVTQYTFPVPGFSAGWFPLVSSDSSKFEITGAGGVPSPGLVKSQWFNYDIQPFVYAGFTPFAPGSAVEAYPPAASAVTNRNVVLGAGAAANVFPAVGVATQKTFTNDSGNDCWYNFNQAASATPANGDQYLAPGQSVTLKFAIASAISFYSALGGQILAYEWH